MAKNDKESIYFIPKNFKTGISILGNTYRTKNVMQMNIVCIPITVFIFFGLSYRFSTKLSISIVVDLVLGYLCIIGINEKPLFSLLSSWYEYHKTKINGYYNNRIKVESRPTFIEKDEERLLPKEKLQKLYAKFKEIYEEKVRDKASNLQMETKEKRNTLYFIDDIGIIEKPIEYMNPKEYRKYQRQQKRIKKKGSEKFEKRKIKYRKDQKEKV